MQPRGGAASALPPARRHGVLRGVVTMLALGVTQACYSYSPVTGRPNPGTVVALDLTDRGRADMAQLLGPSVQTVEGRVSSESDSAYALNVMSVRYQRGNINQWSGEPVTIRKDHVARSREREFSRMRTLLAAGVGVGGVLAFAFTRSLGGSGSENPPPGGGGGGEQ